MSKDILILDGTDAGYILKSELRRIGHTVILAKTNLEAISLLDEHCETIRCVIIDSKLAHNSTMEFLYELRSYADLKKVKIVLYASSKLPKYITASFDWKLLDIERLFYKSEHSVVDVSLCVDKIFAEVKK